MYKPKLFCRSQEQLSLQELIAWNSNRTKTPNDQIMNTPKDDAVIKEHYSLLEA